jgi:hypothetical protein
VTTAVVLAVVTLFAAGLGDPITVVALVGATSTLLSATFAAWAAVKQRRTEDVKLGYEAMREALSNYRTDNLDLRKRVTDAEQRMYTAEQRMFDLTAKVDRCEADKAMLGERVARQSEKIVELERRADGA